MTTRELLDVYLERGSGGAACRRAFLAWAEGASQRVKSHDGLLVAIDARGRKVAWLETHVRPVRRQRLATTPCCTCGALPVSGHDERSRLYACGPHEPVYPGQLPEVP